MKNLNIRPYSIHGLVSMIITLLPLTTYCSQDYIVPSSTFAPNGKWGITLPIYKENTNQQNTVVNIKTKQVITTINAAPGFNEPQGYREVSKPNWATDSSTLLWKVAGKWCPTAVVVIKFKNGEQVWQLDVLKAGQREILNLVKQANPKLYEKAKQANSGNGAAYPDGFTVSINTVNNQSKNISLPLRVDVTLTSNPKQIPNFPANIDARLVGTVTKSGSFVVNEFQID